MSFTRRYYVHPAREFRPTLNKAAREELYKTISTYFHWDDPHNPRMMIQLVESISKDLEWPPSVLYIRERPPIVAKGLREFFLEGFDNWCFDTIDNAYSLLEEQGIEQGLSFERLINNRLRILNVSWQMIRGDWYRIDSEFFQKRLQNSPA